MREALGRVVKDTLARRDDNGKLLPAETSPLTGTKSPFDEQGQLQPFKMDQGDYLYTLKHAGLLYSADELTLSKRTILACDPDQP